MSSPWTKTRLRTMLHKCHWLKTANLLKRLIISLTSGMICTQMLMVWWLLSQQPDSSLVQRTSLFHLKTNASKNCLRPMTAIMMAKWKDTSSLNSTKQPQETEPNVFSTTLKTITSEATFRSYLICTRTNHSLLMKCRDTLSATTSSSSTLYWTC